MQDKFASCTIVIYLEERSLHWLSQCRMAIACSAHFYIHYKGCDPSGVWLGNVGGIIIFAKTHPDKVSKLSAGTCFLSVETVDTQSRFHSKSKPFCIRMTGT